MAVKPTVRVSAGSSKFLGDSYVNFAAALGYGTTNLLSQSTYGYNPLSRNRYRLDMMYRGSWLVRQIVDSVAEDMTRAGITIESDMTPEDESELMEEWNALQLWTHLSSTLKWARLYGGAIGVIMLDGQDPEKPINVRAVQQGQFKGLFVLDRWMVQPSLDDTVKDLGPKFGLPRFYDVVSDAHSVPSMRLHHSRCIRLEGVDLPYWQKISENMWGISVIEPMFDRMTAFDSATAGAAQLVFKAHLRTLSVERLRELIAAGGKSYQAFLEQVGLIRQMQSNEGMTILDASDKFETHQYSFGGLSDLLMQFGQQLSGAAQIPLVRLFGQSPAGMNATGESDIRNYYDMINSQQEARLRQPLHLLLDILHRHKFGRPLPNGFGFSFRPLWQLQEEQKAQSAAATTQTILSAYEASAIGLQTVLKELREQSKVTGVWTNITDEAIAAADEQPPDPMQMQGMAGAPGAMPGADPAASQPGAPAPSLGQPGAMPAPQERLPRQSQAKQKVLALLRPQEDEAVNGYGSKLDEIHSLFGHRHASKEQKIKAILFGKDRRSMLDVHGIPVVIETAKGEERRGNGWSSHMNADYGYIQSTSSPEGGAEQMDCFIGDDAESDKVFVIHQHKPDGGFDEYKCMLRFANERAAVECYNTGFNDGSGPQRIHKVDELSVPAFKDWLKHWPYKMGARNGAGRHPNGAGHD